VGNGAVERILASAFIAFGSASLAGCAPTGGFQTVADPSPSAAAIGPASLVAALAACGGVEAGATLAVCDDCRWTAAALGDGSATV
jgi:hypothetical protein